MFDRRLLRSAPKEEKTVRLHKRSAVCDNCWRELWFQMIFMYVRENAYLMPETIKNRPPCYWGINCRTMEHNVEHAKRYNHMEFQTKF
jgi:E3 ubiquitin-protein ligase CHFR